MVSIARRSIHWEPGLWRDLWSAFQCTASEGRALVAAFEDQVAREFGVRHAIASGSGRLGLRLSLTALGVGNGDGVIVPAYTDQSVPQTIRALGAEPLYVDVDPRSHNIDPTHLTAALGKRAKAIIPTHLFGAPADMTAVLKFARRHRLRVVEDCAHAIHSFANGVRCGTLGDAALLSFVVTKAVNAFGGGIMLTNDNNLAAAIRGGISGLPQPNAATLLQRVLVAYGLHNATKPSVFGSFGAPALKLLTASRTDPIGLYNRLVRPGTINTRVDTQLSPVQAAAALSQMRSLASMQSRRESIVSKLLPCFPNDWTVQQCASADRHSWYFLIACVPDPDRAAEKLLQHGVDVGRRPMRNCAALDDGGRGAKAYPVAQMLMEKSLQIPVYPTLDDGAIQHMCEALGRL